MKRGRWGTLWALWRFVRSRKSGISTKVLLVLALAYLLLLVDLVPDVLPLAGWLDDLGVIALVASWIGARFKRSRAEEAPGTATPRTRTEIRPRGGRTPARGPSGAASI
jgi:Uncharacterized conserved protein